MPPSDRKVSGGVRRQGAGKRLSKVLGLVFQNSNKRSFVQIKKAPRVGFLLPRGEDEGGAGSGAGDLPPHTHVPLPVEF